MSACRVPGTRAPYREYTPTLIEVQDAIDHSMSDAYISNEQARWSR
jgi:hypothetical protein